MMRKYEIAIGRSSSKVLLEAPLYSKRHSGLHRTVAEKTDDPFDVLDVMI